MNPRFKTNEVLLYAAMVMRGMPAGASAFALLLLPPYVGIHWVLVGVATAMFAVLGFIIVRDLRDPTARPITDLELVLHNTLANATIGMGMWACGPNAGSLTPLLFMVLLYNAAFRRGWLVRLAWVNGTATHLVGSLLGGTSLWVAVSSTVVFGAAALAAQVAMGFVFADLARMADGLELERQIAGHAARSVDSEEAFAAMLPPSATRLGVHTLAVVVLHGATATVTAAVRDGAAARVDPTELNMDGMPLGEMTADTRALLCVGRDESPDPATLAAVRDLFVPVAERARHLSRLSNQARQDGLTGLANRRSLDEELARLRAGHIPFGVVVLDLDFFKHLNDTSGHLAGDDVLVRAGEILRRVARTSDTTARYGGEEFCLVLPEADADAATGLADRLRREWVDSGMPVSFSAGVAAGGGDEDPMSVFARADAALYRAKMEGRGRTLSAV